MKKSIKIYDGIRVNHNHELTELKYLPDLWELFNWDIVNDPKAKECADIITRELLCFGYIDLSQMLTKGGLLTVEMLPPKDQAD